MMYFSVAGWIIWDDMKDQSRVAARRIDKHHIHRPSQNQTVTADQNNPNAYIMKQDTRSRDSLCFEEETSAFNLQVRITTNLNAILV